MFKVQVYRLMVDVRGLQSALPTFPARRFEMEQELSDRDDLLSMTFTTNAEAAHAGRTPKIDERGNSDSTSISIGSAIDHNKALGRTTRAVDDMQIQGSIMLKSLRDQKDAIKGTQRKMIDVANVLGMSKSNIRLIERIYEEDKWVLFGGMAVTCLFMYLVIRWFA